MRLLLDPWPADYDAPVHVDGAAATVTVDAQVERSEWKSIAAPALNEDRACTFVDGVRRVEARVLADHQGKLIHGLFGSLAAGCVRSRELASFGRIDVERYLILADPEARGWETALGGSALRFAGLAATENHPHAVLGDLQSRMRQAEAALAEELAGRECVFVDGLSYRATGGRRVVGVVKRILEPYLDENHFRLVLSLRAAERTPLFAIRDTAYARFSCFLRLAAPRPVDHALAGIVRLEIGTGVGLDEARRLADFACALLPRFASTAARDPRAPQNLLPVGALEQEMRRRLGDPLLIRRAIERELNEQRDR